MTAPYLIRHCPAPGCGTPLVRQTLACRPCWQALPKKLRCRHNGLIDALRNAPDDGMRETLRRKIAESAAQCRVALAITSRAA